MSIRFTEFYPEAGAALSMDVKKILCSRQSDFQKIEVLETTGFGRVLLIDGLVMLTEKDEFVYHEMITHVPLYSHPNPEKVLIIGGGDGGTAREAIRHPRVKQVDLVDIDRVVSEVSLEYLPKVSQSLLSEKVSCRFEDGVEFVKHTKTRYDVILIDSTDPINVGEGLFTKEFYQNCHSILKPDGILANQAESPVFTSNWVKNINQKLRHVFKNVHFYQANIPTYPSGQWLFGFASKRYHPLSDFREKNYQADQLGFKYYNRKIHSAAFSLSTFVRSMIEEA